MRFYNLLFVGLKQLTEQTEYEEISEYGAALGLGFIITMNFMASIALTTFRQTILKPIYLLPFFGLTIFLNVKYYNYKKDNLNKLSEDLKNKYRPNMTSGELIGIFALIESVTTILIISFSRQ